MKLRYDEGIGNSEILAATFKGTFNALRFSGLNDCTDIKKSIPHQTQGMTEMLVVITTLSGYCTFELLQLYYGLQLISSIFFFYRKGGVEIYQYRRYQR